LILRLATGTRGATSAEYFLKAGYAVIFMHRQFSLQPFSRHYSHSTNPFLDFLDIEPDNQFSCSSDVPSDHNDNDNKSHTSGQGADSSSDVRISVTPHQRQDLLRVLSSYKRVHALGLLHTISFVTVNDYLWLLRALSQELAVLKRESMFYLAAAVSDFFLPTQKMVEWIYFFWGSS
jgi:phosphopantothenate-cysteine ligase